MNVMLLGSVKNGGIKMGTGGGAAAYFNTDGLMQAVLDNTGSGTGGGRASSSTAAPAQTTFTHLPASYTSAFSSSGGSMNYDAMQQKNGGIVVMQSGTPMRQYQETRPVINFTWMRDFYYFTDFN